MSELEHEQLRESAGLYVLGALRGTEREAFVSHLRTCAECAAEVRSLAGVAEALPYSVTQVDPPASLRSRVLAVTGARPTVVPITDAKRFEGPGRARRFSVAWLSAAALFAITIGLTGYVRSLHGQILDLRSRLAEAIVRLDRSEQQVAVATRAVGAAEARMAVLTASDMRQVDLAGQPVAPRASGRAFWSRERGLVFTAAELPALPAGRVYQLWLVTAQAPVSAGLLQLDASGRVAQAFDTAADLPAPVAIAVTDEPEGGVPAPTGDKYLVGLTH